MTALHPETVRAAVLLGTGQPMQIRDVTLGPPHEGEVLVRGKRVKQVGTVCMDMTMIDVTDVPEVREAEEVVLMGDQGEERISADDLAGLCDTIPYEIFCAIGTRVPRVVI